MFYTASVGLALEHLQSEANRIIYRNLTPEAIVVDSTGYVQLLDMRYATKADPTPSDFFKLHLAESSASPIFRHLSFRQRTIEL